jgi:hypothetical protein
MLNNEYINPLINTAYPPGTCSVVFTAPWTSIWPDETTSVWPAEATNIWPTETPGENVSPTPNLNYEEKAVLWHLKEAWEIFSRLANKHPDDNDEFRHGIHALQYLIGKRVAVRVDRNVWTQYD